MPNLDNEYRDKTSPVWDMSQERALIEQIVSQRAHFYLIVISIVVAAAINAKSQLGLQAVLTSGAVLTWLIAVGLRRTSGRLDAILLELFQDESHPLTVINKKLGRTERGRRIYRDLFFLPCTLVAMAAVGSWIGLVRI